MASRHFPKLTTIWLCLVAHLAFGISTYPDDSSEDNLRALQEEIEHSLISPCCWNMTVDQGITGILRVEDRKHPCLDMSL